MSTLADLREAFHAALMQNPKRQRPGAAVDDREPVSVCQSGPMQLVEPAVEHQAWPPPS